MSDLAPPYLMPGVPGPAPDPEHKWLDVTPEMAAALLVNQRVNRPLRKTKILAYAADMRHGKWMRTGETIKRDTNGDLMDGQHRLLAVIDAGVTVRLAFDIGVEPAAMDVVDTNIPRTFGDALGMRGVTHAKLVASLANRMFLWDQGIYLVGGRKQFSDDRGNHRGPTRLELDEYLGGHPEYADIATLASRWTMPRTGQSVTAVAAALFTRKDEDMMLQFMESWSSGSSLAPDSPILALRERINRDAPLTFSRGVGTYGPEMKLALAIRAWNLYRAGKRAKKLQLPDGGLTNSNFPQPR